MTYLGKYNHFHYIYLQTLISKTKVCLKDLENALSCRVVLTKMSCEKDILHF